jgi:hypothetical protein
VGKATVEASKKLHIIGGIFQTPNLFFKIAAACTESVQSLLPPFHPKVT